MSKVLVEVILPAADRSFDVYIPRDIRVNEVLILLSRLLSELSEGAYAATGDAVLCDAKTGEVYQPGAMVDQLGIQHGDRMMLI
jgi:hypothetical protein